MGSVRMDKHLLCVGGSWIFNILNETYSGKKIVVSTYLSLNNPSGKEH